LNALPTKDSVKKICVQCKVMIVDRHEPYLELIGKGFKAIGYSLKCPGCGHKNTVALMEYWHVMIVALLSIIYPN